MKHTENINDETNFQDNHFTKVILKEIDDENAQNAEDSENTTAHEIPLLDYEAMSLEALIKEFQKLLHNEKVQLIKKHIEAIRSAFEYKFAHILAEKKEAFLEEGGKEMDFRLVIPERGKFNELYEIYKQKRNQYYKELEQKLQANLARRQDIIGEIKKITTVDILAPEVDITLIFKRFKELKEQWHTAGAIPKEHYSDLWNNYNHHCERFYDYLDLNKELREMDFRHNLEEKQKLIAKAEALLNEEDVNKAFRELQTLHKIWKEQTGPVDKEHREVIWEKFGEITKIIHQKRQNFQKELEKSFEENLITKENIIGEIKNLSSQEKKSHNQWQKAIEKLETYKEKFFTAGRVPLRNKEEILEKFNLAVKEFNKNKNTFYKNVKAIQQENLEKKLQLIEIAKANQNSTDWEKTTPLMKKIQDQWKDIGYVPQKHTDKIWKEFKNACNHYFNALNAYKIANESKEYAILEQKKELLENLKEFALSGDRNQDLAQIQVFSNQWDNLEHTPQSRTIDARFHKIIDALYKKLDFDKQKLELLKYANRIERLKNDDENAIIREQIFVRRKIDELSAEILQSENNLLFFGDNAEKNPLVKEVIKKINLQKTALETWKTKLQELKSLNKQ